MDRFVCIVLFLKFEQVEPNVIIWAYERRGTILRTGATIQIRYSAKRKPAAFQLGSDDKQIIINM